MSNSSKSTKAPPEWTQAADEAREAVSSVGKTAVHAACGVRDNADDLAASAGKSIEKFGKSICESTPDSGVVGQVSQAVGETVKSGGQYLKKSKLSGAVSELTELIQRNPLPAVLVGVGLGLLVGRGLRSAR